MTVIPGAAEALDLYRPTDRLMRDRLDLYCKNLVKIVDKQGEKTPFVWNESQHLLHQKIEQQLDEKSWVRAMILKARQLGSSTYVGARYYQRTTLWTGRKTYILTHEDKATQQLFGMAKRVHDNMPDDYRPRATTNNANELAFGGIDSSYRTGTAKNVAGGGRSLTLHNFHGSEVAFWAHAETHMGGVMQALPSSPGTESILESTANGVGGTYYEMWQLAESGRSDYIAIFLPWFIAGEYRRGLQGNYSPSSEEEQYADLFKLDQEQLCWLHFKNIELGGNPGEICSLFRQEYPAVAAEAFQNTGEQSFIPGELVVAAQRRWDTVPDQSFMPRVIGVDTARGGKDRTRIIDRQGRALGRLLNITANISDEKILADKLGLLLKGRPDIRRCYIDTTSIGGGAYNILQNAGFDKIVVGVNFGAGASEPEKYANKRAEIWGRYKDWLMDSVGVCVPPDDPTILTHSCAPGYRYKGFDGQQLLLEPKDKIRARLKFSPDAGDAAALTFAETLIPVDTKPEDHWWTEHVTGQGGDWMTA